MFVLSWMFLDHSKKKPEQMLNLSRIRRSYWRQPANTTDEKFFRVSKVLGFSPPSRNPKSIYRNSKRELAKDREAIPGEYPRHAQL